MGFALTAEFSTGATFIRYKKYRIITKTAVANCRMGDDAVPATMTHQWGRVFCMAQINQHTMKLSRALVIRYVLQR